MHKLLPLFTFKQDLSHTPESHWAELSSEPTVEAVSVLHWLAEAQRAAGKHAA